MKFNIMLAIFLRFPYLIISWGIVMFKNYYWFIHPYFPQLPTFNVSWFFGLYIFLTILIYPLTEHKSLTQEEINEKQLIDSNIFAPWFLLLYSWLFYIIF